MTAAMSCAGRGRMAGPTPSHEIIGQLNCANVGPLNCLNGPPPVTMDCSPGGTGMGVNGNDFKSSSMAMMRSKSMGSNFGDPCVSGGDDSQYLEGCRRIVDFMNRMWQEQKLCDVIIQSQCDQLKAHKVALAAYSDFLVEKFCKFPAGSLTLRSKLTGKQSVSLRVNIYFHQGGYFCLDVLAGWFVCQQLRLLKKL